VNGLTLWNARGDDTFRTACPDCGNILIGDTEKGEKVCPKCGYVTSAPADVGPEWKAMDLEEKGKRVRVGAPTTLALHDWGLTTDIGRSMRDSRGKALDSTMRATTERMRKWQSRSRTLNSEERGLANVLTKIGELCQTLNLPNNVARPLPRFTGHRRG
jgi:transcription initiation factor TFIIB